MPRTFAEPENATFVWIYWHGGARAEELRWSIRSVLKHYHGNASILVVGDPPPWYTGPAIRMDRVGPCRMRRYRDQLDKLYAACQSDVFPSEFTWLMDDTMFTQPVSIADLRRHFYFGSTPARITCKGAWCDHKATGMKSFTQYSLHAEREDYINSCRSPKRETFAELAKRGLPQVDVCTHFPVVIEKSKFLAT